MSINQNCFLVNFIKLELKYLQNYSVFLCLSFSRERKIWGLDIIYFPENLSLELLWYCDLAISFFCWPEIRIWSSLASTMGLTFWWNWNDFDQHDVNLCFFYLVTATHDISLVTVPTAEILSGKNVRAWVSMAFT